MPSIQLSVLRGVCQTPAYVAYEKGYFRELGLAVTLDVAATAWLVPHKLVTGESQFGVIPWTRVAAAEANDIPLVCVAGSGCEEAALVMRRGLSSADVQKVAVPREGGMKDLTAMGLLESLGWQHAAHVRMPSGDGAILSLVGEGADVASMIEPYATMLENIGIGDVIRRTGDLWPGAPGCSLATSVALTEEQPALVQDVVTAFVRGARDVHANPDEAADIAAHYIGIGAHHIRDALRRNLPNVNALRNDQAIQRVMDLMLSLGYVARRPQQFLDLRFLDHAQTQLG